MFARFEHNLQRFWGFNPPKKIGISVSGGVDSMVLSTLTRMWAEDRGIEVHGFIIDHSLRSGSATEQAQTAINLEKIGIVPHKLSISLANAPISKMELVARNKRIQVLQSACSASNINHVLYGHHLDDQYETFIMRSLFNSSWYGLAGIPWSSLLDPTPHPPGSGKFNSIKALRPLLDVKKTEILQWAQANNVPWFEDHTNHDSSLTIRNAIRKLKNEFEDVLPAQLKPEHIWHLQALYQPKRQHADQEAEALYKFQVQDGGIKLDHVHGSATMKLGDEFMALGDDSKVSLLLKLVTFVTPLPVRDMGYRRSSVMDYLNAKYKKKSIGEVIIEKIDGSLVFTRAKQRRVNTKNKNQTDAIEVYKATDKWSTWHFIDNRYWMRWRLPKGSDDRYIGVYLNHGEFTREVMRSLPHLGSLKRKDCLQQPLLVFTEPGQTAFEFKPEDIIGYPVLSRYQNLQVQWRYKELA